MFTQEYDGHARPVDARRRPGDATATRSSRWSRSASPSTQIDEQLRDDLVLILLAALVVLAVGLAGAWLVSRRLRRQTHGMGEREITRMYEYYSAVLHAVREGLLLLDDDGPRAAGQRRGASAARPARRRGRPLGRTSSGCPRAWSTAAAGGQRRVRRRSTSPASTCWSSARRPASWEGREVGAVVTLRDRTELQAVTGELDLVRGLTESLRAQNHEAANRLHTVVSLIEMGRPERGRRVRDRGAAPRSGAHRPGGRRRRRPVLAALLLGKTAQAAERGIELALTASCHAESAIAAPRTWSPSSATSSTTPSTPCPGSAERRIARRPRRRRHRRCGSASATAAPASAPRTPSTSSSAAGRPRPTPAGRARARARAGRPGRAPPRRHRHRRSTRHSAAPSSTVDS